MKITLSQLPHLDSDKRRALGRESLLLLLFLFISVVATLPWVFYLDRSSFGTGHPFNVIWRLWWNFFSGQNGLDPGHSLFIGAPEGSVVTAVADPPLPFFLANLLTRLIGRPVLAYNLVVFLSFPLSAYFSFLLLRYVCKSSFIAFVFSLVFEFSPYRLSHLGQFSLASVQYIPLFFLTFLRLREKPTVFRSILFGLACGINFLNDYYYGYFSFIFLFVFLAAEFFLTILFKKAGVLRVLRNIPYLLISLFIFALILIPVILPIFNLKNKIGLPLETTTNDLIVHSARPWDYFLPSPQNPFLGGFTVKVKNYLTTQRSSYWFYLPQTFEANLYLGMVVIILGVAALLLWIKRKMWRAGDFLAPIFFTVGLVLIFISLPPDIYFGKNQEIHKVLLSYRLHEIFPMFRAYVRLGVYVHLIFLVLAALGLRQILENRRPRKKIIILVATTIFLFFEFFNPPSSYLYIFDRVPELYAWLSKTKEPLLIAENSDSRFIGDCSSCLIFQSVHQKNLYGQPRLVFYDYSLPLSSADDYLISWDSTGGVRDEVWLAMKKANVRYLLIHTISLVRRPFKDFENIGFDAGSLDGRFRLVKTFSDGLVYELR